MKALCWKAVTRSLRFLIFGLLGAFALKAEGRDTALHSPINFTAMQLPTYAIPDPLNHVQFFRTGDGCKIAYCIDGEKDKPALVLSNSIATDLHMWDDEVKALAAHFLVIRYDSRGHGSSDAPVGPYSIGRMALDVLELLDCLKIHRVHFCGLSLGGLVGQWLGVHAPERIDKLLLVNTSPYLGPAKQWNELISTIQENEDMSRFADMFIKNWFSENTRTHDSAVVSKFRAMVLATKPHGLAGSFAAVRDADMRRTIALIASPTLVIVGQYDNVTIPSHGEAIARTIPGAKLVSLPVVHMTNIERRDDFLKLTLDFLLGR